MKIIPILLCILVLLCLGSDQGKACVCVEGVEESVSEADVVFDGYLVEKKLERFYKEKYYRDARKNEIDEYLEEVGLPHRITGKFQGTK